MTTLESLGSGFANALTLVNLFWALLGTTLGTAIGVLPGIGPALTVAVLLPVTFSLDPTAAFIMFGGIYYGAMYGGSTTSILLNTPGETGAIATAIDGHQMALQGRAAAALATAAIGSFVAGTLATLGLAVFAPMLASIALAFGPAEYFALAMLAFAAVTGLLGASLVRGLFSLFLGLALGLVGIDQLTGDARFSFGLPQLLDGIDVVILVIGLFAVGETLHQARRHGRDDVPSVRLRKGTGMNREEWRRSWKPWLRGAAIGFPLGVLPMGGSEIPTFLSYLTEKRLSSRPQRFGRGAIEGVAGPEAANNAATAGVLVPLLTLGVPSSATAAILLAAFQQYGLQPGPLLFQANAELVWTLIASLFIGNAMLLVLNLPLVGVWARVMTLPRRLVFGAVLVLASVGVYGLNRSMLDLGLLYAVGALGFAMRAWKLPLVPAVLGLVLGPMAESQFRRAVAISEGDLGVFVTRPVAALLLAAAAMMLALPWLMARRAAARPRAPTSVTNHAVASSPAATGGGAMTAETYDVAVVGGGNAGLSAALTARQAGARVVVLECAPRHLRGGNSRHARNLRCAHAAPTETLSESYLEDELLADLVQVNEGETDPALARLVAARSVECVPWMKTFGARFQAALRGTLQLSRTNAFFLGGGTALLNGYYAAAARLGVELRYDAAVASLDVHDGGLAALTVRGRGREDVVRARAVVLAAGGFEANLAWLREAWGDAAENFLVRGTPYNTGTVLRLMLDAGAASIGDPGECHAVAIDGRAPRFDGGIVTRLDSVPLGIVVNRNAERFYDEGEDIWPKRYAIWGKLVARQPGQIAYSIVDAKVRDRFIPSMFPPIEAASLDELAAKLGLPAERFLETVVEFNRAVPACAFDPTRLDDCGTAGLAPAKTHWAQRLDTPPFAAYPLRPGITFTYLGLRVDEHARVLRAGGAAFENVYAAGEIMAGNVLRKGYLAGIGMTIGTVFGRIAGESAARHVRG